MHAAALSGQAAVASTSEGPQPSVAKPSYLVPPRPAPAGAEEVARGPAGAAGPQGRAQWHYVLTPHMVFCIPKRATLLK